MNDILLSVIIPSYNAERFIENLLNNLVFQCKENSECEVIVVNDGSKDKTKEIVEKFTNCYSFIKLINQENKGESGARNTGINNSLGKYLYFLDCDDNIENGTIEYYINCIKQSNGIDVFAFAYRTFYKGKKKKNYINTRYDYHIFDKGYDFFSKFLSKKIDCHICSVLVSKCLLTINSLYFVEGMKIGADLNFLLRVFKESKKVIYSSRYCFKYQIRDDSIMQGYKTYTMAQYNSLQNFKTILLSAPYQTKELHKYSNFWIENILLYNIFYYLRSNVKDMDITNKLIGECGLLRRPISSGKFRIAVVIYITKFLPIKFLLKLLK